MRGSRIVTDTSYFDKVEDDTGDEAEEANAVAGKRIRDGISSKGQIVEDWNLLGY